jgi:hypothetical protein
MNRRRRIQGDRSRPVACALLSLCCVAVSAWTAPRSSEIAAAFVRSEMATAIRHWKSPKDEERWRALDAFMTTHGMVFSLRKGHHIEMDGFWIDESKNTRVFNSTAEPVPPIPFVRFSERPEPEGVRPKRRILDRVDDDPDRLSRTHLILGNLEGLLGVSLRDGTICRWRGADNWAWAEEFGPRMARLVNARIDEEAVAVYLELLGDHRVEPTVRGGNEFRIHDTVALNVDESRVGGPWVLELATSKLRIDSTHFVRFVSATDVVSAPLEGVEGVRAVVGTPNGLTVLDLEHGTIRRWHFSGHRLDFNPGR